MELAEFLAKNSAWSAVVAALQAYLVGEANTLDEALGLTPIVKRGAPRDPSTEARLQKAVRLILKGWSWPEIYDEVGGDERELRRMIAQRLRSLVQPIAAKDVGPLWTLRQLQAQDLKRLRPSRRTPKKRGG